MIHRPHVVRLCRWNSSPMNRQRPMAGSWMSCRGRDDADVLWKEEEIHPLAR